MLRTEAECIEYIHSAGRFGKKTGLDNIKALLRCLGNPQRGMRFVHIAGTNGKGSTSCMIANILTAAGYKTGMNTSPYIEKFNERLCIDGTPIDGDALIRCTNTVAKAAEKLKDEGICPIEFELICAIGFLYFKEQGCDFAVLECGLGGRFDATNAIDTSEVSVICKIGLDHTRILGDTAEKIAFEKAGIIKENRPVVLHPDICGGAKEVIMRRAASLGAPVFETESAKVCAMTLSGTDFEYEGRDYHINLTGTYQAGNAALAINTAKLLSEKYAISDKNIADGIANARWKCRFEYIPGEVNVIIDGAHNPDGIEEFAKSVRALFGGEKKVFVVGMLNDKDFSGCAETLASLGGRIIVTDVPSVRQTSGREVYEVIGGFTGDCEYIPDLRSALSAAKESAKAGGFVCVAGSLYLAGEARKVLGF